MNESNGLTIKEQVGMIVATIMAMALIAAVVKHESISWAALAGDMLGSLYICMMLTRAYKRVVKKEMNSLAYFVLTMAFEVAILLMLDNYGLCIQAVWHAVLISLVCCECFVILCASSFVTELMEGK